MDEFVIEPLFDNVLILPEEPTKETAKGIIIPHESGESPKIAEVIAVGEGKIDRDGTCVPMKIKAGDRIVYKPWATDSVKINGKEYLLIKQEDVRALVRNKATTIK